MTLCASSEEPSLNLLGYNCNWNLGDKNSKVKIMVEKLEKNLCFKITFDYLFNM